MTPSGNKRKPGSWAPFAGGKRICFGKTFADASLKIVAIYLCHYFNFSFVDKRFETEFPVAHLGMSKRNKIEVVLTSANPENVPVQQQPTKAPASPGNAESNLLFDQEMD